MHPGFDYYSDPFFSSDVSKFYFWNLRLSIELCDDLTIDEIATLKKECDTYKSPYHFFFSCLKQHHDNVFKFLKKYKGCGTIAKSKRDIKLMYTAIIICEYTKAFYQETFDGIDHLSDFKEFNKPNDGNATFAEKALNLILFVPSEINYWPFNIETN